MRLLVWQWGRYGGGPRAGVDFTRALNTVPGVTALLSLSNQSELMRAPAPPECALPVDTYAGFFTYLARTAAAPLLIPALAKRIAALNIDAALCAMPGPLDLVMHAALRRQRLPYAVVVHDADPHPGDRSSLYLGLQRQLIRRADALVVLSGFVEHRLAAQGLSRGKPVIRATLPALPVGAPPPIRTHGGPFRLLSFGRLLTYKGLDLLADALAALLPRDDLVVRVIGEGPDSRDLARLRAMPGVTVENRWVPEAEVPALLAWADGVVLSYREASQSGVAAAALAARRLVVATQVGGLAEQVEGDPAAIVCDVNANALCEALKSLLSLPTPPPAAFADATPLANALQATLLPGFPKQDQG